MNRTQEARLQKMEQRSRNGDVIFVAWGRDREAARRELASAFERGTLGKGDLAIAAVWPHAGDLPLSRPTTYCGLRDREFSAIIETIRVELGITDLGSLTSPPIDDESVMHMTASEIFCRLVQGMPNQLGMPTEPGSAACF